ncbi:unnamed protein product [Dovyalis caffra]|uniref:J domain-containing protein n=1 Tax=Dovyalis caffra TaxID=77055 RepID=A0AAV1R0N0_9ROSI|nr:unnamed protein product [Dovyalis caffra]
MEDSGDEFPGFQTCVHKEELEYRRPLSRLQRRAPCPLQIKPNNNASLQCNGVPKISSASAAFAPTSSFNSFYRSKDPIPLLSPLGTNASQGKGMSRDYSLRRTRSGKKPIRSGKGQGSLDNIVVIDVDSDEFENVIIIDVPESLQQKLRGSSVVREGRRFPCIISIDDDDEDEEDECDTVDDHEINAENDGNLDSDGTSSQSSPPSGCVEKSVHSRRDADGCRVAEENRPAFKLRKCNRTYAEKAPSRNRYGLDSDSETDSSEDRTSDCEVMEDSLGEVREQWEKASLKRKSKLCEGLDDQASPCSSHSDVHPNVEVENRTKQNSEPAVCSTSKNVNFDKVNSSASTAAQYGVLGGFSSNAKMGKPFAKCNQKGESFSGSQKSRADENIHFHWMSGDLFGGGTFVDDGNIYNKFRTVNGLGTRFPPGPSSWSNQDKDDKQYHNRRTCFQDMQQNTTTEHAFPDTQRGPNLRPDDGKASVLNEDDSLPDDYFFGEIHNANNSQVDSKEEYKEFTQVPSSCKTYSNEPQCREKFVPCAQSSEDKVVENVVAPWTTQEVSDERSGHKKMDGGAPREKSSQGHDTLSKPGTSNSAEGKEAFSDFASSSQLHYERNQLCASHGDLLPSSERDIINDREKLKETDEYKQAIEEEWAARQRQLQIQAEEAQRLRKRRKAETLRILDMERRQKQRVEEVRETQKKDEENLSKKERFRVEVRKGLYRLEVTCINMASLLRGLGIHVEGGLKPSPNQVHAAYKRALLKFHPDRTSKTDIREQVEAEEKFKLISRMKEKFLRAQVFGLERKCESDAIGVEANWPLAKDITGPFPPATGQPIRERDLLCAPGSDAMAAVGTDIINVREKLKETAGYKHEAAEARILRRRRKAESSRVLDLRKRQKRCVEKLIIDNKYLQVEENLNLKERLHVEARNELDKLEITCNVMASFLCSLGIQVEGGVSPLSHGFRAAYKRALMKFHPYRVSRTDMQQQVGAEEKFKLVSVMKKKYLST